MSLSLLYVICRKPKTLFFIFKKTKIHLNNISEFLFKIVNEKTSHLDVEAKAKAEVGKETSKHIEIYVKYLGKSEKRRRKDELKTWGS
ncbi:hypothetical protein [Paenibacillus chibensis]|uniref:hypothetical protein n=1 Tax=Paenibacillus chibensis TaxID=59846 RepID=UPI0013E2D312|nr:hypothetical protein [Paenibacillus chibensis]MEC0371786.1 hypothetical protein [Paenibacillus chibensis]